LRLPVLSLGAVALAAAAATRASTEAIRLSGPTRIAFVLLAHEYGWTHQQQLAHACACSTRTIRNVLRDAYNLPDRAALMQAAHHCLADERLTRGARRREPCEPWTLPKKRKISA
jgi:hypothetical protein